MTPKDAIGVALIGTGAFGRKLAAGCHDVADLRLVAVHDVDPASLASASAALGVPAVADLGTLLDRNDVQGVIIATPHGTHLPIGVAAVAAGRHLFVEKPLALTVAECTTLLRVTEAAGVRLLVGHVTRLLPVVVKALALLDAGRIGEPFASWMVRHQPLPRQGWFARRRDFGTLLHSPAVHNLDLMNRILGRASSVTALAAPSIQAVVEYPDIASMLIGYEGGRVGSLGATVSDPLFGPGGTSSSRIVGSGGGMAFDVASGTVDVQSSDGSFEHYDFEAPDWGLEEAIRLELANFAAIIRGDAEPFVRPAEALRAVELCEAADVSIRTGRIVELPLTLDEADSL